MDELPLSRELNPREKQDQERNFHSGFGLFPKFVESRSVFHSSSDHLRPSSKYRKICVYRGFVETLSSWLRLAKCNGQRLGECPDPILRYLWHCIEFDFLKIGNK